MIRYTLVVIAGLFLAACASFETIQQSEPKKTWTLAGTYDAVAGCIASGWNTHLGGRLNLVVDTSTKVATIVDPYGQPWTTANNETRVTQVGPDAVLVEYRRIPAYMWAHPDWYWETVEGCAQA